MPTQKLLQWKSHINLMLIKWQKFKKTAMLFTMSILTLQRLNEQARHVLVQLAKIIL